jgi:hypothetical protein
MALSTIPLTSRRGTRPVESKRDLTARRITSESSKHDGRGRSRVGGVFDDGYRHHWTAARSSVGSQASADYALKPDGRG